ncbi:MAG: RNA polymerase sigma factor [Kiritimatiellae bacterium]|nr:RNA polymerase sigma factor [Kiritimatiellia bacterium]
MDIVEELRTDREKGARHLESEFRVGLMSLARRLCRNESDAEELVNSTFAEVVESIDNYVEQSAFFAWMCRILVRRHSRDTRRKINDKIVCDPNALEAAIDDDAQEAIYREVDAALLRDAIETLPEDIRKTLMMHYFMGLSVNEVARILALSSGTVKWRLSYARQILAAKMGAKVDKMKKTPGGKAVLLALLLCGIAALGAGVAGVSRVASRMSLPASAEASQQATSDMRHAEASGQATRDTRQAEASNLSTFQPFNFSTDNSQGENMNKTTTTRAAAILAAATVATGAAIPASGGTHYYVAPGGTGDYTQGNPGGSPIVAAQKATSSGDVIHLATGLYDLDAENGAMLVADGVELIGGSDNPEETILFRTVAEPGSTLPSRVIYLGSNAIMRNLTSRGGNTVYQAGGVLGYSGNTVHKQFSVSNCIVENASALYKGGGSMGGTWRDCVIRNCTVRRTNRDNNQEGSGGGIWGGTLYNCVLTNNVASYAGGAIAGDATDPCAAYDCTIAFNTAPYGAGAGSEYGPDYCRLYNCNVVSNDGHSASGQAWGGKGGGVYNCFVTNSLIAWNTTRADVSLYGGLGGGAGVYRGRIYDSTIEGNRTALYWKNGVGQGVDGGGAEEAYLEKCRIIDNYSVRYAGGTFNCTNVRCLISGNQGTIGGGTFNGVNIDCTICSNTAYGVQGGACYNSSTYNCFVFENTSKEDAVLVRGYHQWDVIVDNVSQGNNRGSAIASSDNATMDVAAVNCTIVGNGGTASRAQVFLAAVTNSIVVGGTGAGFVADVMYGEAVHSLFGSRDGGSTAVNCLADVDPKFVIEPGEGEGPYSLKSDSPCVGAGLNLDWMAGATDILGNARLFKHDPTVDIGACERWWKPGFVMVFR